MRLTAAHIVLGISVLLVSGCRVTPPGALETKVMIWTKHHMTVGGLRNINPIHSSAETIEAGKQNFASYCIVCHGRDGQNTGVPFANSMTPLVPSLKSPEVQQYSDGQLHWIIENGIAPSGMPSSRDILSDQDIWSIVVYLRHLPPAGSLGEPRAFSGEEYAR